MESIIAFFESIPFAYPLFRIFVTICLFLYLMYSVLIVGQTNTLRKTVVTEKGDLIYFISIAQLVVAGVVFLLSLIY